MKGSYITNWLAERWDFYNYTKQFKVETNASFEELETVLSQEHNVKLHPMAFVSKGFRKLERNMSNYSSRILELLSLKWAIKELQ